MAIYDCFTYFNEDVILDIRFHTLYKFVDKFIIVEATRDHSGREKKLNFDINYFKKFSNKIIYIVVDDIPEKVNLHKKKGYHSNFVRENYHRNCISRGLSKCLDDDLVMISDADEIPNLLNLDQFKKNNKFSFFRQKFFKYKFNKACVYNDKEKKLFKTEFADWIGTGICLKKYLKSPQWLRDERLKAQKILFFNSNNKFNKFKHFFKYNFLLPKIIENGGWHFSSVMTPQDLRVKIESFSHGEFNNEKYKNIKNIEDKINSNIDVFDPTQILKTLKLDNINFPNYIWENRDKLAEFIE